MSLPFFTIGHSDRSLDEFTYLLCAAGVELVVDVRKFPGSRSNPQFNADVLCGALPDVGVRYRRARELGGRRAVAKNVVFAVNGFWQNRSFHNYADYALSVDFRAGLGQLREWGADHRTAIMCSEAVWWRCHRRIVADHLLAHGEEVFHIMNGRRIDPAQLTPGALVHADQSVTYPAQPLR